MAPALGVAAVVAQFPTVAADLGAIALQLAPLVRRNPVAGVAPVLAQLTPVLPQLAAVLTPLLVRLGGRRDRGGRGRQGDGGVQESLHHKSFSDRRHDAAN
jgi:hypothetical protein